MMFTCGNQIQMTDGLLISAYGSHNAAIAAFYNEKYYIIELERWLNKKNAGLAGYLPAKCPQKVFDDILNYIFEKTNTNVIDIFLSNYFSKVDLSNYNIKQHKRFDHHAAHAACAFYQSPYNKSLIFTYDGGGNGAFFNVYLANTRNIGPKLIDKFDIDLGFPYMILADHMEDITKEPLNIGNLVYAGKLMGLCAYGKVNEKWLPHFEKFYKQFRYAGNSYAGGAEIRYSVTKELFNSIGIIDFDLETTRFKGQFSWDMAATSQQAFENVFLELAMPYISKYSSYPVCLSGGCALNVILNSKLINIIKDGNVYIPPNTNDCGIAIGGLLEYIKPEKQIDITYSGLPIMDTLNYSALLEDNPVSVIENITEKDIAILLENNYIIGIIHGNSEHGPRALGNRSIICNPVGNMKDILNAKVKHREWYRPFAPVVKFEDVSKYFDFSYESQHMTYIATVNKEYDFPAITHVDGTGRLQTITKDQNEFLYTIIDEFDKLSGYGVILNTSFNVNGKPILTRLSDAFEILIKTELDCIYYNSNLIFKQRKERELTDLLRPKNISMDSSNSCLYILMYTTDNNKLEQIISIIEQLEYKSKKICIIANQVHENIISSKFSNINLLFMDENKFFYKEMLESAGYKGKEINFIKPLWIKDIVAENNQGADFHIIVDLSLENSFEKLNHFYAKYMNKSNLSDSIILNVCDETLEPSMKKFIDDKFKYDFENKFPSFQLYAGYTENILKLTRTYEGNLRYHLFHNRGAKDNDFLTIVFLEDKNNYTFME